MDNDKLDEWGITPVGEPCRLDCCPPGLFVFQGSAIALGFRSEYWTSSVKPDAYVVENGEYFWGGTTSNTDRAALIVQPVEITPTPLDADTAGLVAHLGAKNLAILVQCLRKELRTITAERDALAKRVGELEGERDEAYAVVSEIAILTNPDWKIARSNPVATLDRAHDETTKIIGKILASEEAARANAGA